MLRRNGAFSKNFLNATLCREYIKRNKIKSNGILITTTNHCDDPGCD